MAFFSDFGTKQFSINGVEYEVEDITKRVSNFPNNWYNLTYIEDFYIQSGVRPDQLANQLYGDVNLWWTFYILNGLTDADWPLDDSVINDEILSMYNNYQINSPVKSTRFESSFAADGKAISHQSALAMYASPTRMAVMRSKQVGKFYEWEQKNSLRDKMLADNESKRSIKIVSTDFIYDFARDFKFKIKS